VKNLQKIRDSVTPAAALRFGLGMTFLYGGVSMLSVPGEWSWLLPASFASFMPISSWLIAGGVCSLFITAGFLVRKFSSLAALVSFVCIFALLAYHRVTEVTFPYFGLLLASLALYLLNPKTAKSD
jgi:hypothetical protein